ncbi:MAG TPA: LysR substrate-binding domain-containing protein [Chthoniobacterales bacterium]|nr:LysR substrate-binding domain-containing protein [Chthoniobacterales bacterium]
MEAENLSFNSCRSSSTCSDDRRFPKGAPPKLKDFLNDSFLSFDPQDGHEYEDLLREYCRRVGGFEPRIGARANSAESLVGMIAAGSGVFLGAALGLRGWETAIDFYLLGEGEDSFELSAMWKKESLVAPTIHRFFHVMEESIKPKEAYLIELTD